MEGPRGEFWSMPEVGTRMRGAGPSDVTGRTRAALVPLATARLVTRPNGPRETIDSIKLGTPALRTGNLPPQILED
ncbi:hypothetical protein MSG28_007349 [Choristoneura fumiferana]|uniref:Uncharacterized protein n=1 Tax=Choristoneura fumiferana TaxID=7141 RepID=A0ACC0JX99_CHOFU|nr:hypothetical protein MSG28_007349 [Choristoneura fumiferana]